MLSFTPPVGRLPATRFLSVVMTGLLLIALPVMSIRAQASGPVTASGEQLRSYYQSLHVESLWLVGHHINWETGEPNDPEAEHGISSHCSAFVAAACKRLNVYILRPPEHPQLLLASAQFDWLASDAAVASGWKRITASDPYEIFRQAQSMANQGFIVTAVVRNPDPHRPGHAALVLPDEKSRASLMDEGPTIIMAGEHNYASTPTKHGFKNHIVSWPEESIWFYCQQRKPFP
jgi:hypothetical protein